MGQQPPNKLTGTTGDRSTEIAAHTPGPWEPREQKSKDGRSLGWIVEHSNGRIGWSCYATAEPNEGEAPPYPIGQANARLIAAAPDMLEALGEIQNWDSIYDALPDRLANVIIRVIAKATGERSPVTPDPSNAAE